MIIIKDLIKKFRDHLVLDIKHLEIGDNEKVAIVGQNGAGKSTLAEIIMKTQSPTSGSVELKIDNLIRNAVFQETGFSMEMSILSVAKYYADLFNCRNIDLDAMFIKFDIADVKKKRFPKLSGGQKQKFKLLLALMNNPNLLLLDELTTSLDYKWRQKIFKLLHELTDNAGTILMVSHDPDEIASLCDRVILIEDTNVKSDFKLTGDRKEKVEILRRELEWNESDD